MPAFAQLMPLPVLIALKLIGELVGGFPRTVDLTKDSVVSIAALRAPNFKNFSEPVNAIGKESLP